VKKEKVAKPTGDNMGNKFFRIILSVILAVGAYFTARHFLPQSLSTFWIEFSSLIISLLALKAISIAYGGRDNKVGNAVFVLMLAIFAWQLIDAYADYEPVTKSRGQVSGTVKVETLLPRAEPYIYHLKEVGDRTPLLQGPPNIKFDYGLSSHNYGYHTYFNDGTDYPGDPKITIPEKKHLVMYIVATKPNQYIKI